MANYTVVNKDGLGLFESDVLADAVAYVANHQSGDESDPDYAYAVIDRSHESSNMSICLVLNTTTEADVITKLDSVSDMQEYIIGLIRADI
jgi:hypothetical protein